jgi:hypothetical protein
MDQTITSHLITRFFFLTPEIKARDKEVRKRHRNQESPTLNTQLISEGYCPDVSTV